MRSSAGNNSAGDGKKRPLLQVSSRRPATNHQHHHHHAGGHQHHRGNRCMSSLFFLRVQTTSFMAVAVGWMVLWNAYYVSHNDNNPAVTKTTAPFFRPSWTKKGGVVGNGSERSAILANDNDLRNSTATTTTRNDARNDVDADHISAASSKSSGIDREPDFAGNVDAAVVDDPNAIPERVPTHHACDGYEGMYHIAMGDIGGAAGTVFFQFVMGQIIYAERNNLVPWVYLNNVSNEVYDDAVHNPPGHPGVKWKAMTGRNASRITRPDGHFRDTVPGPLVDVGPALQREFNAAGTGVWEHYFEPVSDYVPGDRSCQDKPYVTLDLKLITPGIHGFVPWAPSCWRYQYLPDYITKPHIPINEWLEPQRVIGYNTARKYLRLRPYILQAAERANPHCSWDQPCLGMHIR